MGVIDAFLFERQEKFLKEKMAKLDLMLYILNCIHNFPQCWYLHYNLNQMVQNLLHF